jgi:hypothetical protein
MRSVPEQPRSKETGSQIRIVQTTFHAANGSAREPSLCDDLLQNRPHYHATFTVGLTHASHTKNQSASWRQSGSASHQSPAEHGVSPSSYEMAGCSTETYHHTQSTSNMNHKKNSNPSNGTIHQAQLWDCYSYHFTLLRNDHLCLGLHAKVGKHVLSGEYLFSAAHLLDGYSDSPDQDKEFIFTKLDNGRLTIQPTNRVVFTDHSFTIPTDSIPRLKLSEVVYSCE